MLPFFLMSLEIVSLTFFEAPLPRGATVTFVGEKLLVVAVVLLVSTLFRVLAEVLIGGDFVLAVLTASFVAGEGSEIVITAEDNFNLALDLSCILTTEVEEADVNPFVLVGDGGFDEVVEEDGDG